MVPKPTYEELEQLVKVLEAQVSRADRVESELTSKTWLLNALLENLNVGVFMVEAPSGKPVLANNYATNLLGRGILNHAGRTSLAAAYKAYKYNTDEYYPEDEMPIVRALKGECTTANDMVVVHPDGRKVMLEVFGSPVKDDQGNIIASLATFSDITERRQAEKALRESEERYAAIIAASRDGIFDWDIIGESVFTSGRYQEIHGVAPSGIRTLDDWKKLIHPEDSERILQALEGQLKEQAPISDKEYRIIDPRGNEKWLLSRSKATFDTEGRPLRLFGTVRDITKRKRAEEAINAFFDQSLVMLCILDYQKNRLVRVNNEFLRIMGRSAEELTSMPFYEFVLPDDRDITLQALASLAEGIPLVGFHNRTIAANGDTRLFEWNATLDLERKLVYAMAQDVTDKKKAEEEHEKLQNQLIQAQKMESVGRLAGGVAHDFNNMLGVIIGNADLAIQNLDPSLRVHEDLQEIKAAARRSADLTRQLLAFARRQTAVPVVLDLNDTVSGMLKMLRRLIGEDVDLIWMPGANLWPVKIDPAQIDQVLANLCVNARDAIAGVGRITIETRNMVSNEIHGIEDPEFTPGNYVMLSVSDDGCGMDKETLDNMFEPFFTTKTVGEGTGLGLSTVYGIVKQNHGLITVSSEPDAGAAFRIYFPQTTEAAAIDEDGAAVSIARGSETVLLVEDEKAVLRMSKAMLERFGYTVLAAHKPNEALEIVTQYEGVIHLLVTDVVMPEMNGKELKNQIEKHYPAIKALFMSGYTADVIMHRGILQKNVNFLQKPFTVDKLVNKVREVLDQ